MLNSIFYYYRDIINKNCGSFVIIYLRENYKCVTIILQMQKAKFEIVQKKYKGDSSVISLRLSNDLIAKFDEIAKETGRTRNEIISMALEFALDNLEIKK